MAIQKIAKLVAFAALLTIPFVFYPWIHFGADYLFRDGEDLLLHRVPDSETIEQDEGFSFDERPLAVSSYLLFALMFALSLLLVPVTLRAKHDPMAVRFERSDRYVFHEGTLYRRK
ncbi:MAG: hypothetical protein D6732_20900 [Methanobacteriota archaeon]|nr:MAG: hypothetical protein D6732_20900 [Euryarchaeota archaeon]